MSQRVIRILVVDDEQVIGAEIAERLERLGYEVVTAHSGADALNRAGEDISLALIDVHLGDGMDGIETAQRIRARHDIPVVYLTAFADQHTIARAKCTEPLGYLCKPITDDALRSAVEIAVYRHDWERRRLQVVRSELENLPCRKAGCPLLRPDAS
jgi:CheY-like chemotaxis protein